MLRVRGGFGFFPPHPIFLLLCLSLTLEHPPTPHQVLGGLSPSWCIPLWFFLFLTISLLLGLRILSSLHLSSLLFKQQVLLDTDFEPISVLSSLSFF